MTEGMNLIKMEKLDDDGDELYEPKWEDVNEDEGKDDDEEEHAESQCVNDASADGKEKDNDFKQDEYESKECQEDDGDVNEKKDESQEQDEQEEQDGPVAEDFNVEEVLKFTVKLSDGTEEPMFSCGPQYTETIWPVNCHLCSVGNLTGAYQLQSHINGVSHKIKLDEGPPDAVKYRRPLVQTYTINYKNNNPIKIFPGERIKKITPEYYDRLQPVMEYAFTPKPSKDELEILEKEAVHEYNLKAPVLGLCYAFKYKAYNSIEYFCGLCKTKGSGEAYQHFVGGNHQIEYVRKHFPTMYSKVVDALSSIKSPFVKKKFIRVIFRKIYRKFEELRGFRKINFVNGKDFKKNTKRYIQRLRKNVHYNENMLEIPESELGDMIKKCLSGEAIIEPDPISLAHPNEGARDDGRKDRKRDASPRRRNSPPRKRDREDKQLDDTSQNWDRYRRMLGAALDDIDEMYEEYEEIPEKHPDYEREWRRFWRRRTRELERDNIDPNHYDFKPEWLDYFADLLKDLHSKAVAKQKFEIKRSLRLPYNKRSPSPIRRRRRRSKIRSHPRRRRRSPTPDSSYLDYRRVYPKSREYCERSRREEIDDRIMNESRESLSVISVLRLLTALEDQLGSMGPKALELLSRAILFEKENNLPADELLMDKEYYIFFVTCKEKLKGQLIADIVSITKINAVNRIINDVESLLELCDEYIRRIVRRNPFTEPDPVQSTSFNEPLRNIFDNSVSSRFPFGSNDDGRSQFKRGNDGPRNQFINENTRGSFSSSNHFGDNKGPCISFSGSERTHEFGGDDVTYHQFIKTDLPRGQLRSNEGLRGQFDSNDASRNQCGSQFSIDDKQKSRNKSSDGIRNQFVSTSIGGATKSESANLYTGQNEDLMWQNESNQGSCDSSNYNLLFNSNYSTGNCSNANRSTGSGNVGMMNKCENGGNGGHGGQGNYRDTGNIPSLLGNTFRSNTSRNFN